MQHQTPQFIDIEDKIIGPLTLKQFIYVAGGGGIVVVMYLLLPFWIFIILATPVIALSGALAFYKFNDRPFINILESAFNFATKKKLYLWQHRRTETNATAEPKAPVKPFEPSPSISLSSSRLKDMAWDLEVKEESLEADE